MLERLPVLALTRFLSNCYSRNTINLTLTTELTKEFLEQQLRGLASKKDLDAFATKKDIESLVTRKDLDLMLSAQTKELKAHTDDQTEILAKVTNTAFEHVDARLGNLEKAVVKKVEAHDRKFTKLEQVLNVKL